MKSFASKSKHLILNHHVIFCNLQGTEISSYGTVCFRDLIFKGTDVVLTLESQSITL